MITVDIIKRDLGENYKEGTEEIIKEIIKMMTISACNVSNRRDNDSKLDPYIYEAVLSAYERRGKTGNTSSTDGSMSDSYVDIKKKMRNDIIEDGMRLLP